MNKKNKLSTFLLSCAFALVCFNVAADEENNTGGGIAPASAAAGSLTANQGHVICTAAVNEDGTLASKTAGSFTKSSTRVNTGIYRVFFKAPCNNITAARGYARFVQVDTLGAGNTNGHCATGDSAGDKNGIYVRCYERFGELADRSFFLFVTK